MTILSESEVQAIRALAAGDKSQLPAATQAFERAATVHGSSACVELEFMSEILSPAPDLLLRARYRKALLPLLSGSNSREGAAAGNDGQNRSDALPTDPRWVSQQEMPSMPRGWYWAAYPGGWEWYCPKRNATRGIDHGDTNFHELLSTRYWGPFVQPPPDA